VVISVLGGGIWLTISSSLNMTGSYKINAGLNIGGILNQNGVITGTGA